MVLPYKWLVLAHSANFLKIYQRSVKPKQAAQPSTCALTLLSSSKPRSSSSQPLFMAWPLTAQHEQWLSVNCWVVHARWPRQGAGYGSTWFVVRPLPGDPSVGIPGGQLCTKPEHYLRLHLRTTHPKCRLNRHYRPVKVNPDP